MRVIAGKCRSLQLKTPKGMDTRPTQDRIKETLFNIIQNEVRDAVFVDLFAGSGGIGIEALSRGAKKCYFCDNSKEALKCIEDNLNFTKLSNNATIIKGDAFGALSYINEKADVVFLDPPYMAGYENKLFEAFKNYNFITEDTLIILEASIEKEFDFSGFELIREKKYKTNKHLFWRMSGNE